MEVCPQDSSCLAVGTYNLHRSSTNAPSEPAEHAANQVRDGAVMLYELLDAASPSPSLYA